MKLKKSVLAIFGSITAMALTSCGSQKDVSFWSSFGSKYANMLKPIVNKVADELKISIKHESQGSIKNIHKNMVGAIGTSKYPSIAMGYPDHFAQYHGSGILVPLDSYFKDVIKDYDKNYMPENYIYDSDGEKHLYGVPFNKSTELLGYNGVFVDYVAERNHDETLKTLPATWDEWALAKDDPTSKAGKYYTAFNDLVENNKTLWAIQDADGSAHDFTTEEGEVTAQHKKVLDYSKFDDDAKAYSRLMGYDALDNAFITLLRQWGSHYTELKKSEYKKHPKERAGTVLFASKADRPNTLKMLKFFNKMHKDKIFGTPDADLNSKNYCTEAFAAGRVMFTICSSGGLSYNTTNWEKRFRMAPIPYHVESAKYVISQGMNICMTKKANKDKAVKVMKALTTGKYQTEWSLTSGYFPASASAEESKTYQDFIKDTSFKDKKIAIYREGHQVNYNEYKMKNWNRFVDDAFIDSATVRDLVAGILPNVFKNIQLVDIDNDGKYNAELKKVLKDTRIQNSLNIVVDTDLKL